jgi:transcriptional regulator with AAA-type ATPase domain
LFLDEVGEASAEVQALLLRARESGEIQPVGGEPAAASTCAWSRPTCGRLDSCDNGFGRPYYLIL